MNGFKTKRSLKHKILINITIITISFFITINLLNKNSYYNEKVVKILFKGLNKSYILDNIKNKLTNPNNIIYSSLNKSVPYESIKTFSESKDIYFDYDNAKSEFIYEINDKSSNNKNKVLVYIYNTHQLEEYKGSEVNTLTPNVMLASYNLKNKLSSLGINSIVENADIKKYLNKYKMNYLESYDASRYYIFKALKKYKDIQFVIDLHRDSIKHSLSTVTYNNKKYARVLFVVGLGNKNYKSNLKLAKRLDKSFNEKVSNISRGYVKYKGDETNAVYNQDTHKNAFLIEVGGYQNNMEEVNNTLDVLSQILYEYLKEE